MKPLLNIERDVRHGQIPKINESEVKKYYSLLKNLEILKSYKIIKKHYKKGLKNLWSEFKQFMVDFL